MKKIIFGAFIVLITLLNNTSASAVATLCDPSSSRFTAPPIIKTAEAKERSDRAYSWIKSMIQPIKNPGDGSTISPSTKYDYSHQGAVSGSFTLNSPRPSTSQTPIVVTSPSSLGDDYRGVVSGTAPTGANPREIRAYLYTDSEYHQSEVSPGAIQSDGSWTIDLSSVPANRAGSWRFRLYDTTTNQQIGESWPRPETYENLIVQSYAVTDSAYLLGSQPASADGTFHFPSTNSGEKMFRLVDTTNNETLAEYFDPPVSGIIRSYEYLPGQQGYGTSQETSSYVYDQALALLVAIGKGDKETADLLFSGLKLFQTDHGEAKGGFMSGIDQKNYTSNPNPSYYTGGNSFAAYAALKYYEAYGNQNGVLNVINDNLKWLNKMKTTTGEASGLYRGGETFNGSTMQPIAWHSTEHNTDLWHVFELASRALSDQNYKNESVSLANSIVKKLWNESENRLNQGFNDDDKALDTASWGSIFLSAVGEHEKAKSNLDFAKNYFIDRNDTKGYTPYADRANSIPTIWFEGTFGVAHAQNLLGRTNEAKKTIEDALAGQQTNGAFPYALDPDIPNGRTNANSVASTAWFLLANSYPSVMWPEVLEGSCRAPQSTTSHIDSTTDSRPSDSNPKQLADTGMSRAHTLLLGLGMLAIGLTTLRLSRA